MSDEYRIPKREVWADAHVLGMPRVRLRLYLSEYAASHTGFELPSDLLNGRDTFIPVTDADGAGMVLGRDGIVVLSIAAEEEPPPVGTEVTSLQVELLLEGGESVRGTLLFVQPEARCRLPDFLNDCDPFFPVRDGAVVHLVNKALIVRARLPG